MTLKKSAVYAIKVLSSEPDLNSNGRKLFNIVFYSLLYGEHAR